MTTKPPPYSLVLEYERISPKENLGRVLHIVQGECQKQSNFCLDFYEMLMTYAEHVRSVGEDCVHRFSRLRNGKEIASGAWLPKHIEGFKNNPEETCLSLSNPADVIIDKRTKND